MEKGRKGKMWHVREGSGEKEEGEVKEVKYKKKK